MKISTEHSHLSEVHGTKGCSDKPRVRIVEDYLYLMYTKIPVNLIKSHEIVVRIIGAVSWITRVGISEGPLYR